MPLKHKNQLYHRLSVTAVALCGAVVCVSCVDPGVLGEQKITSSAAKEGFKGTPKIDSLSPISGRPGDVVLMLGSNFRRGLKVDVGGQQADLTVKSGTEASFAVPEGSPGEFQLKLISGETLSETDARVYRLAEGYPVYTGDASVLCQGYKFFNAKGELSEGTRNCLYDDQVINPEDIVLNKVISGVKGTFPYCSTEGEKGCIVDDTYAAADMTLITPGVIKKDVSIAGVTGAYPSYNYPLEGYTSAINDLTGDTFIKRMTSDSLFQYFDSNGNRYQGRGDTELVATNLRTGVEIEILNTTGKIPFTAHYVPGSPDYIQLEWHNSGAEGYLLLARAGGEPTMEPTAGTPYSHDDSTSDEIIYTGSATSWKYYNPAAGKIHHFALYEHDSQRNFSPYPKLAQSDTEFCSNVGSQNDEWIAIPGNADYNTNDFCVMKFEASRESQIATNPISRTQRNPWTDITRDAAIEACQSIGGDLISNDQWMTIATKIVTLEDNWSDLAVGQGTINIGHSDGQPSIPCPVPSDQTKEYLQDDNSSCIYIAEGTPDGENDEETQKRTHILSEGVLIWDLGGNVMEWTRDSLTSEADRPYNPAQSSSSVEYTDVTQGFSVSGLQKTDLIPSQAINGDWDSSQGIGMYKRGNSSTPDNGKHIVRGGSATFLSASGLFTAFMEYETTDASSSTGFRCVWEPSP